MKKLTSWNLAIGRLFALSLVFLAGASGTVNAGEVLKEQPVWYTCRTSQQCLIEKSPCGEPIGINRAYQNEYVPWRTNRATMIRCAQADPWPKNLSVSCEKSVCTVTKPEK